MRVGMDIIFAHLKYYVFSDNYERILHSRLKMLSVHVMF